VAHEIEVNENGKASFFYVGQTPWHGLGQALNAAPSISEAITAAGLDWKVGLKPLFTAQPDGVRIASAVDHQATYRQSDGSILGVVGPNYHPLQNSEAFNFFQPFVDSGLVELHTAGSLREGKRVFVLAKVKNATADIAKGDAVESYVLLSNSHDGSMAVRVGFSPIRVVCANSLRSAINSERSKLLRVKHTSNVNFALEEVRETMNVLTQEFEATTEQYRSLAKKQVNEADLRKYVKTVLGIPETEHSSKKGEQILDEVRPLFEKGRGNDIPEIKGTLWAAMNSFNEYLGYKRGKNTAQDARLDSLWFGQGATLNQKALDVALEMVKAG
jgi:phage/plasmid-like protein (TIGR03299 family)